MPNPLEAYKGFVRKHAALVVNLERLAHWVAWSPDRFQGSEFSYEAFNAAVGLLGLYNDSILSGDDVVPHSDGVDWGFMLAAVEQVQTLVELRALQLEARGKMSRYGPLIALELLKFTMRLRMWAACRSHLALESVSREDKEQYDSEHRLRELLAALVRLRRRYDPPPPPPDGGPRDSGARRTEKPSAAAAAGAAAVEGRGGAGGGGAEGEGDPPVGGFEDERAKREYTARQAAAAAVRAAAIAPDRPPCACGDAGAAAAGAVRPPGLGAGSSPGGGVSAVGALGAGSSSGAGLPSAEAGPSGSAAAGTAAAAAAAGGEPEASTSGSGEPAAAAAAAAAPAAVPRPFRWGWWGSASGASSSGGPAAAEAGSSGSQGDTQPAVGTWGPPERPLSAAAERERQRRRGKQPLSSQQQQPSQSHWIAELRARISTAMPDAWPWQRLTTRIGGGGGGIGGGSCGALEERLLERQTGWRLDPAAMDVGDRVVWFGEMAYLLRPLIYVVMLKRHGLRSWRPWAASLGVELLSQYALATGHVLLQRGADSAWPPGSTLYSLALLRGLTARRWGPSERQELLARRLGLLRYLLRSPCYNSLTRPAFARGVRAFAWLPLLGGLGSYALELVDSMQGYYTYIES